jgi:hypothetical protein
MNVVAMGAHILDVLVRPVTDIRSGLGPDFATRILKHAKKNGLTTSVDLIAPGGMGTVAQGLGSGHGDFDLVAADASAKTTALLGESANCPRSERHPLAGRRRLVARYGTSETDICDTMTWRNLRRARYETGVSNVVCFKTTWEAFSLDARPYAMASAQAICPSKPSDLAISR